MKKLTEEQKDQDDNYSLNLSCVNDNLDFIDDLEDSKDPSPKSVMQEVTDFDFNYANESEDGSARKKKAIYGVNEEKTPEEINKARQETAKLIVNEEKTDSKSKNSISSNKFTFKLKNTFLNLKKILHIFLAIAGLTIFYFIYLKS